MYTLQGRVAGVLFNEGVSKGSHMYRFNPKLLATGHYLLTLNAKCFAAAQQIVIMQ